MPMVSPTPTHPCQVLTDELREAEQSSAKRDQELWIEQQQRAARDAAETAYGGNRSVTTRENSTSPHNRQTPAEAPPTPIQVITRRKALDVAQSQLREAEAECMRVGLRLAEVLALRALSTVLAPRPFPPVRPST